MIVENQNFAKYNPPIQRWIVPLSIFLSFFIFGGTFLLTNFCPNFILDPHPKYFNLAEYINKKFIESSNQGRVAVGYLYWIINGLSACFVVISNLDMVRGFLCLVTFRP
ncbi:MAG: hypothetical protein MJ200_03370 [Mycoplasmoidaceae bacterium]|nr:hypothetical protein [Mycoplasmoidaceae bacterium]